MSSGELGRAVRRLRRARGVTIDGLAYAAQMHPTYLSSIERGERNPSWGKLCDLATALGVSVALIAKHAETGIGSDTAAPTVAGKHLLPGDELLFLGSTHRITRLIRYQHPRITPVIGTARIAYVEGREQGFMTVPDEDEIPVSEDTVIRVKLRLGVQPDPTPRAGALV
jgi:transcriptional regulator with XRE-family HTH domain